MFSWLSFLVGIGIQRILDFGIGYRQGRNLLGEIILALLHSRLDLARERLEGLFGLLQRLRRMYYEKLYCNLYSSLSVRVLPETSEACSPWPQWPGEQSC